MKKLRSLGDMLVASVDQLAADPTRLSLFADKGSVAIRPGSLSFVYAYTASLWVQDFAGDLDLLMVPLLAWIAQHQPDLIASSASPPFTFELELLDKERSDIMVTVALSERVSVAQGAAGWSVTHLDDIPMTDAFADVPAGVSLWQAFGDDCVADARIALP